MRLLLDIENANPPILVTGIRCIRCFHHFLLHSVFSIYDVVRVKILLAFLYGARNCAVVLSRNFTDHTAGCIDMINRVEKYTVASRLIESQTWKLFVSDHNKSSAVNFYGSKSQFICSLL